MGMWSENPFSGSVWDEANKSPELKKWIQLVAVYRDGSPSYFYVDGEEAPNSLTIQNSNLEEGEQNKLYLGSLPRISKQFGCDCWVKDVKIYNRALDRSEVKTLSDHFQTELSGGSGMDDSIRPSDLVYSNVTIDELSRTDDGFII